MRLLLDSNAYSRYMAGDAALGDLVRAADEVLLSAVVIGEQLFGFRRGTRYEENLVNMRTFLNHPQVRFLPVGQVTADRYSRIMATLRAKGRPVPTNDAWIAAHAMETGADLVSADRHFEHIDGIALVQLPPR